MVDHVSLSKDCVADLWPEVKRTFLGFCNDVRIGLSPVNFIGLPNLVHMEYKGKGITFTSGV